MSYVLPRLQARAGMHSAQADAPYRSGRSKAWLRIKNPDCPAVRRGLVITRPLAEALGSLHQFGTGGGLPTVDLGQCIHLLSG
jgi:hypothetical protein